MTTPTSRFFPGLGLQPPIVPQVAGISSSATEVAIPCPAQTYIEHIQEKKIIDEQGNFLIAEPWMSLEKADQDEIVACWKKPQTFVKEDLIFSWNLHHFLTYFVPYFTKTFKGTTLEMTEGVYYSVGKPFWKRQLEKMIPPSALESLVPEKLWSFCTAAPRCYELSVKFPNGCFSSDFETILEKFHLLTIYFVVVQKYQELPMPLWEALREFETILELPQDNELDRLKELRGLIKDIFDMNPESAILELLVSPDLTLRVVFNPSLTSADVRLQMDAHDLTCQLNFSHSKPYQLLHDQLISRSEHLPLPPHTPLGKFLSSRAESLELRQAILQIMGSLAPHCYISRKNPQLEIIWNGPDPIHLVIPYDLPKALEQVNLWLSQNPHACLTCFLEALDVFFSSTDQFQIETFPLLSCLLKRLKTMTPLQAVLIHPENKTLLPAWTVYAKSPPDQEVAFLLELAPQLEALALPFALNRVCLLCQTLQPEEKVKLLAGYLDRALRFSDRQVASYQPKLIELLATHPQLLKSYPKAHEAVATVELKHLQELLPSLETQSKNWWNHFSNPHLDEYPKERNHLLQEAILKAPFQLYNKEGFSEFFKKLAHQLLQEKKLADLMTLIKKLPGLERPFLMEILKALTQQNPCPFQEIRFLNEQIKPQPEEVPLLADLLISSYPLGMLPQESLIDDLIQDLPLFVAFKNVQISPHLVTLTALLVDKSLWSKYTKLLESLKKEDLYLEVSITLMEQLSTMEPPPTECFKKPFPKLERRLSDPQKKRVAVLYATVLLSAIKHQKEGEIVGGIPSMAWMMNQLQTEPSWEIFAKVFLALYPRYKLNLSQALWIGSQLPSSHPLAIPFIQFLLGLKELSDPQWKPIIAILINRTTYQTEELFQLLMKLSVGDEKVFFQHCWDLPAQQLFEAYYAPETLEGCIRDQAQKILSRTHISVDEIQFVFQLLKKLPSTEYPLWDSFLKSIPGSYPALILQAIWDLWYQKHPVQAVQPHEEVYWDTAVRTFFHELNISRMSPVFSSFFLKDFSFLLSRFQGPACKAIAKKCLYFAVQLCWIESREEATEKLKVVRDILINEALDKKIGNGWQLLESAYQARLTILLINQKNPDLFVLGEQSLTSTLCNTEASSQENQNLFHAYCLKPYVPINPAEQYDFHRWIERSWKALKSPLGWSQQTTLITRLCKFDYKQQGPEKIDFEPATIYQKWEELITKTLEDAAHFTEDMASHLHNVSSIVIQKLSDGIKDQNQRSLLMFSLRQKLHLAMKKLSTQPGTYIEPFEALYSAEILTHPPDDPQILESALEDLCQALLSTEGDITHTSSVQSFISSLPQILQISCPHQNLMNLVMTVIDRMMNTSWIVKAKPEEPYHWVQLLSSLCRAVQKTSRENQSAIEKFTMTVFMNCTHPDRLKTAEFKDILGSHCCPILGCFFLTQLLQSLSSADFETLIKEIPYTHIKQMLFSIMDQRDPQNPVQSYLNSLAVARLIRYMKPEKGKGVSIHEITPQKALPPFNPQDYVPLQFLIRAQWILALGNLIQYFKDIDQPGICETTLQYRFKLAAELTQLILSHINDQESYLAYSPFLIQILSDDLLVAMTVDAALKIPSTLPPSIAQKLTQLKALIQMKIKKLQS